MGNIVDDERRFFFFSDKVFGPHAYPYLFFLFLPNVERGGRRVIHKMAMSDIFGIISSLNISIFNYTSDTTTTLENMIRPLLSSRV